MNKLGEVLTRPLVAALILIALGWVGYARVLQFDFLPIWDDGAYVLHNPSIRAFSIDNLSALFSSTFVGHYAPVTMLSYLLDYQLWQVDPGGYHLTNLLLHLANTLLLLMLLRRLGLSAWVSLWTALLFVLHPINIENVAWIAERKTLLSTLLFFLALERYLSWRAGPTALGYALALLCFTLAVFAKTTVIVLPLLLVWLELWLARRLGWQPLQGRQWLALLPFALVAAVGAGLTLLGHLQQQAIEAGTLSLETLLGTVYPTALTTYGHYVGLLLWPLELNAYYDTPLYHGFGALPVLGALLGWGMVTTLILLRGSVALKFWYGWFWICLLPVSNLIPLNTFYADRYMYTPAIGIFVLLGLGCQRLLEALPPRGQAPARLLLPLLLITVLLPLHERRLGAWADSVIFWETTAQQSPNLYKPHLNLGATYERLGRLAEAERAYSRAAQIWPNAEVFTNLRRVAWQQQRTLKASP